MKVKYLMLGGGVSCLSFVDRLASKDYLICEAKDEIGGYCRTIKQDGFVWDYAGHFFHFKNEAIKNHLLGRMQEEKIRVINKKTKISYIGNIIDYPFQKNIHQLPKNEFIDCLFDLFNRDEGPYSNFKEMLYSKFGKSISEFFLIPYNEKLYSTDLSNLDPEAMGRFFPYAKPSEIVNNFRAPINESYNSVFYYPDGGVFQYVKALAKNIDTNKISTAEKILSVDIKNRIAKTSFREISFQYLISSAPFTDLLSMVGFGYDSEIYNWNKVLVFNLGFDRKGIVDGLHWIYYPDPDLCFYRVGFYDNILSQSQMSIYVELGFPKEKTLEQAEIAEYKSRVLRHLTKCGVVQGQKLVSFHSVVMDPAYVHINRKATQDVQVKKNILVNCGVHSIGRYGGWKYCSIEDNIIEATELADIFNVIEQ